MRSVRLAYRDNDRKPVIYCIKAMAERHYAVNVHVLHVEPQQEFEAALFDNSCDVIIEHIEYLHTAAAKGKKITFFCAPQIHRGLKLVVPQSFDSVDELRGHTMAVRDLDDRTRSRYGYVRWDSQKKLKRSSSKIKTSAAGNSGRK